MSCHALCDYPITGYHAKRGGKVLCEEIKDLQQSWSKSLNPETRVEITRALVQRLSEHPDTVQSKNNP